MSNKLNPRSRIVVIGIDCADPDLVQRWSQEGRLPFLRSLMESGACIRLTSSSDLFPDAPWLSFSAGVTPAKHGYYSYLQLKRGTTDLIRADARHCRYLPFWSLLQDKKVAAFRDPDLPGRG